MPTSSGPQIPETVTCAQCGAENRPSRFFCSSCGAYLRSDEDTWEGEVRSGDGTRTAASLQTPKVEASSASRRNHAPPSPIAGSQEARSSLFSWDPHGPSPTYEREPERDFQRDRRGSRRRSTRVVGVVLILLLLTVGVVLAAVSYSVLQGGETSSTLAGGPGLTSPAEPTEDPGTGTTETSTETTAEGGTVENPVPVPPDSVAASSELESEQGNSYSPDNLFDEDLTTAWQEGAEGNGPGEWLRFSFTSPVTLARLELANGYQKDERRFLGNARIQTMRIEYEDGPSQTVTLEDVQDYQSIDLAPKATSQLTLIIESVYPGDRWEDAAVSEIHLYEAAG